MSVLGRLLISSAERLDLPDLLSLDSYVAGDFKYLLKGLVGDSKPFVIKGFDIIDPQNAIGTQSCSIRVAESAVLYPGSNAGPFFHGLPEGNPLAQPLVPELRKNATNFIYLTLSTFNTSVDTRAFWDPDKDGGEGGEFTQDVNTESALQATINVSTASFPQNTIPIAKVVVGPVVITSITDCRDLLFRLANGGITPDPFSNYAFRSLPTSSYKRVEPPVTMTAGGVNPFEGADKNILSLKEWMDVVMTKLKELGGTNFWYDDTSTYNIISNFLDAMSTTFKSKGSWVHNSSTPGQLVWTDDVIFKLTQDTRDYILRAGTITLANEQVAYLNLIRNASFNSANEPVSWSNGQPYVNTIGGAVGLFANLAKGDWVKKINDPTNYFLRVEEFYDSVNLGGSTTTAGAAKSIRLSGNYLGTSEAQIGRYDKGVYLPSDIQIVNRNDAGLVTSGGNFHWIAIRSDTIENVSNITSGTVTGTITSADAINTEVTATAHGLLTGDKIHVTAPAGQIGTYTVEVTDANHFHYASSSLTTGALTAYYAIVTTAARDNGYGLQLESANHGFRDDDTVTVAGTTNYNAAYSIHKRSATTFEIAVPSNYAMETIGTATLAKIFVHDEDGMASLLQGQSGSIGGGVTDNLLMFIGSPDVNESYPNYTSSRIVMQGSSLVAAISALDNQLNIILTNPTYDERTLFPTGLAANTTITIPVNSRNASIQETYSGAKAELSVFVGQLMKFQGIDWIPINNTDIQFTYDLTNDTEVHFRKNSLSGGVGGGGGGSIDLTNITVNPQPSINGAQSLGTTLKAWDSVYLKDQSSTQVYQIKIVGGILQAVPVP